MLPEAAGDDSSSSRKSSRSSRDLLLLAMLCRKNGIGLMLSTRGFIILLKNGQLCLTGLVVRARKPTSAVFLPFVLKRTVSDLKQSANTKAALFLVVIK